MMFFYLGVGIGVGIVIGFILCLTTLVILAWSNDRRLNSIVKP